MTSEYDPTVLDACTRACNEMHTFEPGCQMYQDPQLEINFEANERREKERERYFLKKRQKERMGMLEPQVTNTTKAPEYEVRFTIPHELTDQARFIVEEILPEFLAYFVRKNNSYAKAEAEFHISEVTGTAGQWGELYRKICMLKAPMWDHQSEHLSFEDSTTLRNDLFGHVLLGEYYHLNSLTEDED